MIQINPYKQYILLAIGIYIFLYGFPFPLNHVPYAHELFSKYVLALQEKYILFFGNRILGMDSFEKIQMTGSGDTTFDYVRIPALFSLSLVIGLIFFLIRKTRAKAEPFYRTALIYARYHVGITLITYGVAKFLEGQFPGPSFSTMETIIGNISPMGLAWRFFGYSDTYKIFMGLAEVTAGFLLLFSRTAILGAFISISVCLNIVLVNFSFDVPVKLFSSHLLLFSILVLLPKAKPVFEFFILHKTSTLGEIKPQFSKKKHRITWLIFNLFIIAYIPITIVSGHLISQQYRTMKNDWEGLYYGFDIDPNRPWNKLMLEKNYLMLQSEYGPKEYFSIQEIKEGGEILIQNQKDEKKPHSLHIKDIGNNQFKILLNLGEKEILAIGSKKDKSSYELVKRGFHWINEYPYNR
ncbi:hypothetical protein JYB64_08600 [Algoriphagus aestuarii]|nr:hypothetical protein [Algoriphagus aestuarii]